MIPLRIASELLTQLDAVDDGARTCRVMQSIPIFLTVWHGDQFGTLERWHRLEPYYVPDPGYLTEVAALKSNRSSLYPKALSKVSELLDMRGSWDATIALRKELIAYSKLHGDRQSECETSAALAFSLLRRSQYNEARVLLDHTIALAHAVDNAPVLAAATGHLGLVHMYEGRLQESIECFQRIIPLLQSLGNRSMLLKAIGNLGIAYKKVDRYDRALECFERAREIAEAELDLGALSKVYEAVASIHSYSLDYENALHYSKLSYDLAIRQGDAHGEAISLENMGSQSRSLGRYDRALEFYSQALPIYERLQDAFSIYSLKRNRSLVYWALEKYTQGYDEMLEAYEGAKQIGANNVMMASLYYAVVLPLTLQMTPSISAGGRGWLRTKFGDRLVEIAHATIDEGMRLYAELPYDRGDDLWKKARVIALYAGGRKEEALELLEPLLNSVPDEDLLADLYHWAARIEPQKYLERAIEMNDRLATRTRMPEFSLRVEELRRAHGAGRPV